MTATKPAGYTYDELTTRSPLDQADLHRLFTDVMWSEEDARALRRAGEILRPRISQLMDVWYDFIGSTPHLVATFAGPDGSPDQEYLARVRARFERWVLDLCTRDFDDQWLAYQEEIALRHHTSKKNQTDMVDSPSAYIPMSDMLALIVPVTLTTRRFLAEGASDPAELQKMADAWFKAVTITLVLWTRPYAGALW